MSENGTGYVGIDKDYFVSVKEVLNITAETGALETQRRVRELPSADVVEVVRCKDCMYNNNGWCGSQEYGTRHVEDNDYCSYGEMADAEAQEESEIINARRGEE